MPTIAPSQKLASVLAISVPVTNTSDKEIIKVPCIYYLLQFQKS